MRGMIGWASLGIIGVAAATGAQFQLAALPPVDLDVNMLFVPPPALTKALVSGHENIAADGLWLGLIQYYGDRVVADDRHAVNLYPMYDLITDLDPYFWFAYWLGGWTLGDNKEGDAAVALLEKGERVNPTDYNYPYMQGYLHFLFRGDYVKAASCFERTALMKDAPRFAKTMAARMYQKQGKDDLALQIWRGLYEKAADPRTKEIARKSIERIEADLAGKKIPR